VALIDARVFSDGKDHDPRAITQIPPEPFDGPGMLVSMNSLYSLPMENGKAQQCNIRFKVRFQPKGGGTTAKVSSQYVEKVRANADTGDPNSQLEYGLLLREPATRTGDQPIVWFIKAAQAGNAAAQYLVGHEFLNSHFIAANDAAGEFWLERAARAGVSDARLELAHYYLRDTANADRVRKAVVHLEGAVRSNRAEARFYLAALLSSHPDPSIRDPQRALEIFNDPHSFYDLNPVAWEIRAAAHAHIGAFGKAVELQKRAIGMAKKFRWNTAPMDARLSDYQAERTWTGDLLAFY
jgi:tetratricopeptide (TPR) repeat protein